MAVPQPVATSSTPTREVMSSGDVSRALRRIAHEILERNKGVGDLVLLGIPSRGVPLAHRLAAVLAEVEDSPVAVGSLDVTMHRDDLRHQPVRRLARTEIPPGGIDDKVVVLVDDVLFHGRTIRAALEALAELGRPRSVRLAVLVDRGHRELPIRADHVGKNLPTAASERVRVRLAEVDGADAGDAVTISGGER
jgi:pyrimidine operon attenuation protein/uracil phosphoribosyltransferase